MLLILNKYLCLLVHLYIMLLYIFNLKFLLFVRLLCNFPSRCVCLFAVSNVNNNRFIFFFFINIHTFSMDPILYCLPHYLNICISIDARHIENYFYGKNRRKQIILISPINLQGIFLITFFLQNKNLNKFDTMTQNINFPLHINI